LRNYLALELASVADGFRGADDKHVPSLPTLRYVPEKERPEALLRERSLLYVASSRTRDALVVTWSGRRSGLLGMGSSG